MLALLTSLSIQLGILPLLSSSGLAIIPAMQSDHFLVTYAPTEVVDGVTHDFWIQTSATLRDWVDSDDPIELIEFTDNQGNKMVTASYPATTENMFFKLEGTPRAPVEASSDFYFFNEGNLITTPAPGLLENDVHSPTSMIELLENPKNGTLSIGNDGSFEYQPTAGFFGADSFRYRVVDGTQTSEPATVDIRISEGTSHLHPWPHELNNPSLVASPPFSGLYAVASADDNSIEIRDIRESLVASISNEQISELIPWGGIGVNGYGVRGMAYTHSGRQLFIAIIVDSSETEGESTKDAILAYNSNLDSLRLFARTNFGVSNESDAKVGMVHYAGKLYVGMGSGIVAEFAAARNTQTVNSSTNHNVANASPVVDLAIDTKEGKLYAAANGSIHAANLSSSQLQFAAVASAPDARAIAFGRSYGSFEEESLFILNQAGSISVLSKGQLQPGSQSAPEHWLTAYAKDISATPCGRILLAEEEAFLLSDLSDANLDFEDWLRDEFNQHLTLVKSILWPDGEPEGWVIDAQRAEGLNRIHPASSDSAGWAMQSLILSKELFGDTESEDLVRKILLRYSGLHPDGIAPEIQADGEFPHWFDFSGNPTWEPNTSIFSTMKMLAGTLRAKTYFNENEEIQRLSSHIIRQQKNRRDMIRERGKQWSRADELGPMPDSFVFSPWIETYLYAEQAAALDPTCAHSFTDYWLDRSKVNFDFYLEGEPVNQTHVASFVYQYAWMEMRTVRHKPEWIQEFRNIYSVHSSWTDDNPCDYFTVFSAGSGYPTGYTHDTVHNHPGQIAHFPSLIGYSLLGNTAPAVAAYQAYREGRRTKFIGSEAYPQGAELLARYSNLNPSWVPDALAPPDSSMALFALSELIEPGILERTVAIDTYRSPEVTITPSGESKVEFSLMTPRRILASKNGETWDSFGFQSSPATFASDSGYKLFQVEDPEGPLLFAIENHDFENGSESWETFGDATILPQQEEYAIYGKSLLIRHPSESQNESVGVYQTLDISDYFEGSQYIIRADGLTVSAANGATARLFAAWDSDLDFANGVIAQDNSQAIDDSNKRAEFLILPVKPAGANYLHIGLSVNGKNDAIFSFDNLSIVRLGAPLSFANSAFEEGNLSGWSEGGTGGSLLITANSNESIEGQHSAVFSLSESEPNGRSKSLSQQVDISSDPLGTRYLLSATAESTDLDGTEFALTASFLNGSSRILYGDTFQSGNTTRQVFLSGRKRAAAEGALEIRLELRRIDAQRVSNPESVKIDSVKLFKITP